MFPDGLMVLFGEDPAPPVVLPSMELPVVVELPAVPPAVELPPAEPAALLPAEPPPAPPVPPCASAKVEPRVRTEASATVVSFMIVLSLEKEQRDYLSKRSKEIQNLLQRDGSRQAARIRILTRRQPSSIACHSRLTIRQTSLGHLSG